MIQFHHVWRKYGSKMAVEDLTLTVPPGELFAFLGPNGAGKTTAIKMLVGLLRPTAGSVTVCGVDATSQTRQASRFLGFVPEEAFLYEKLSGREFLEFVAEVRGMDRAEMASAIGRESQRFELEDFLDDLIETYSHGMQQRLVFAAALLHDPPVLVVDEPTVGLDPKSTRLVKDLLRERTRAGGAVFMSTHTLSIAEEIADRIGIIDQGRLNFLGTLDQLRQEASDHQTSLEQLFLERTNNHPTRAERPGPVPAESDP
ncbi:MAG: ABC transporter ATP-binding protein [Thermoguttaceae bacterium]